MQKRDVPLYAVSIGGESRETVRPLRAGIVCFLTSHCFRQATVRLRDDLACLEFLGVQAAYAPDIVLAITSILPELTVGCETRARVGIQNPSHLLANQALALSQRERIPPVVFSHSTPEHRDRLLKSLPKLKACEHFIIDHDVFLTLRFIRSLRATIGDRLHFGVAGLAFETPFYVVDPRPKTSQFFTDAGIPLPVLGFDSVARFSPKLHDWHSSYARSESLGRLRVAANDHVEFVERVCRA